MFRMRHDTFLYARGIVYFPYFVVPGSIGTDTDKSLLSSDRIGIEPLGIVGQKVIFHVVAPDADSVVLLSGKEYQSHVGRIDGRIIRIAIGDLPAHEPFVGGGLEYLVGFSAGFREDNLLAVGRIRKVQYGRAVGLLYGRTLFA